MIDPHTMSLREAYAKRRAFSLRPKLYFFVGDKRITLEQMQIDQTAFADKADAPLLSDTYQLNPAILSCTVTPAGKRTMDWQAFVR